MKKTKVYKNLLDTVSSDSSIEINNGTDIVVLKEYQKVNRIVHLSDIHIKNDMSCDKMYYDVFAELFRKLNEIGINKDDLIVLTGDIMDFGLHVTATAIDIVKYFFNHLSNFCPIVLILGNHDLKNDKNLLIPIVGKNFTSLNPLYFLLDNKIYLYGDVSFSHTRFDFNIVTPPLLKTYNGKKYTRIALYHGIMNGTKTENNYGMTGVFSLKDFKGFDYCMFGDIHIMEYLNKAKTAWYAGSLLIQSRSEDPIKHGFVLLDLNKNKSEMCIVNNKQKKVKIILDSSGKITNCDFEKILNTTEILDLQVKFSKYDDTLMKKIKDDIMSKKITLTHLIHDMPKNSVSIDDKIKVGDKDITLSNISTKNELCDFLLSYIEKNNVLEDKDMIKTELKKLIDANVKDDDLKPVRNLEIYSIEFDNIMTYGKAILDFKKIDGITLLCEQNGAGKSILCESVSIALCGRTPRCENPSSFVRLGMDKGTIIIKLKSNNIDYDVIRTFYKSETTAKRANSMVEIRTYKNREKNTFDYITSKGSVAKKNEIESIINKKIITYEEIFRTIVISQTRAESFIMSKNKGDILFEMVNLSYLTKVVNSVMTEKRNIKCGGTSSLKKIYEKFPTIKKQDFTFEMATNIIDTVKKNIDVERKKMDKILIDIKTKKTELKEKITVNEEKRRLSDIEKNEAIQLKKKMMKEHNISKNEEIDIEEVKRLHKKYDGEIKTYKNNLKLCVENEEKIAVSIQNYEKNRDKYNYDGLMAAKTEYDNKINNRKKEIEDEIETLNYERKKEIDTEMASLNYERTKYTENKAKCKLDEEMFNEYKKIVEMTGDEIYLCRERDMLLKEKMENVSKKIKSMDDNWKISKNEIEDIIKPYYEIYRNTLVMMRLKEKFAVYNEEISGDQSVVDVKNIDLKINNLKGETRELNSKITNLRTELRDLNSKKYEDFEKYNKICDELNPLYSRQNKIIKEEEILKKNIIELEKKITDCMEQEEKYKANEEMFKVSNELDEKIKKIKKTITKLEENAGKYATDLEQNKKEKNKHIKKSENDKMDYKIIEDEFKTIMNFANRVKIYDIMHKNISSDGLTYTLLKEIITVLQTTVSAACEYIGHEKLYINTVFVPNKNENTVQKFNHKITITTDECADISNLGSFQSNITELIFKLAFLKINRYFNCDFIIVDEIFDGCSHLNEDKAVKLIQFFGDHKKMLIVSHNRKIINTFDKQIHIIKNKTGNSLS